MLKRRVEQQGQRAQHGRSRVAEKAQTEPVGRPGSQADDDGLADQQNGGARPQEPGQGEDGEDRVDVRAEARRLLAVNAGDLEESPVGGVVDRLHHVAQIEPSVVVAAVPLDRKDTEEHRHQDDRRDHHDNVSPHWASDGRPIDGAVRLRSLVGSFRGRHLT